MAEAGTKEYRQELMANPDVLTVVRRLVTVHVRRWGLAALADSVVCCVNELLANVDRHTRSPYCILTLQRQVSCIRVVVEDTSNELPVQKEPDWTALSGRGLALVDSLADRWGVEPGPIGKSVWFEICVSEVQAP
ncbi:ATP-binding protein [Streptomyces sp. NPDC056486]|uniref:ATP-binding protein n=1 Tax=Streptomyces sp. NPDC056486 TaxID=3345835 RepID=UPI00368D85C8